MTDKMNETPKVSLTHSDGWGYEITAYEDVTEFIYYEFDEKNNPVEKDHFSFCSLNDIQVFEAAIRLRKRFIEIEQEAAQ